MILVTNTPCCSKNGYILLTGLLLRMPGPGTKMVQHGQKMAPGLFCFVRSLIHQQLNLDNHWVNKA